MSTTSPNGLLACSTVLPALGLIVVGLRFYARSSRKANFSFDDWAQIPALVCFWRLISHNSFFAFRAQAKDVIGSVYRHGYLCDDWCVFLAS